MASTSADIRAFTGAPTKIVWVQDAGDTACVFSELPTLRLMGLDTEDGKGERAILPDIARYSKPVITSDGMRVVFGDLDKEIVNIVNWDGTGLRTVLTHAEFQDVWTNPRTGVIWIYAKVAEPRGDKTVEVIRRYRLDDPSVSELIWDKTPIFNFMVSGDGRAASGGTGDNGNTPQGVFFLPNKNFVPRNNGCWPSMSPDNSLRSWVFSGNHHSIHFGVTLDRTGKGYTYGVEFYDTPGLTIRRGEETYHPRWSNHVRFIAITSPYSKWTWLEAAKITNDVAEKVEIYLGEFNEDMKGMKRFVQVTNNQRGDYWPDAWIQPPPGPPAWLDDEPDLAEGTAVVEPDQAGQVFRWDYTGAANQLIDKTTGTIRQSNGLLHGTARFERYGVLDLHDGFFAPNDAVEPWLQAIKASDAFSIEVAVTPAGSAATTPVILAFGKGMTSGNVILSQIDGWLTLHLRGDNGRPQRLVPLPSGKTSHVIVSYAPGNLTLYVNGQRVLLPTSPDLPVSGWTAQPLTLGDIVSGGHDWAGLVENIGLLGREIGMTEAWQRADHFAARVAERTAAKPRVIVDAQLIGVCPPADPLGIAPYRRCLSVQQYKVVKVIEGQLTDKIISVAQWSVLDAKVVPTYLSYREGRTYRLALEAWSDHPEQESERLISGDFDDDGGFFYQVRELAPPSTEAVVESATTVKPAATTPAPAVWTPSPQQPGVQQLTGPVALVGESKPDVFNAGRNGRRDVAGQDILLEAPSLPEVVVTGALRLDGNGLIRATRVLEEGFGYISAPKLELSGGDGQGGVLLADMAVTHIELLRLGSGYTSAPEVVIAAPDIYGGRQATATAEVDANSGAMKRLKITDGGSGYLRAPRVTLRGGDGTGAVASTALSLQAVHILNEGSGYTTAPKITITGGDGAGAEALTLLQVTTLRYTDSSGDAFIRNQGTIDQTGAIIVFNCDASGNALGKRGFENVGTWIMRHGAMIQFSNTTAHDFKPTHFSNAGALRLLSGSRLGLDGFENTGVLELSGGLLGQPEYGWFNTTFNNLGEVKVLADAEARPSVFGAVNPSRNGDRKVFNGGESAEKTGDNKARFQIGDGHDAAVFNVVGGQVSFVNQPGATLLLYEGAALGLLTNDNGGGRGGNRIAKLINSGDMLFAGTLRVLGNHVGFTGLENAGRLVVRGSGAAIERLPSSGGPGGHYWPNYATSRLVNLADGIMMGDGTVTYQNSTGNEKPTDMWLINLGNISPGSGNQPGKLSFVNTNIEFGAVRPADYDEKREPEIPLLKGEGLLSIPVLSATNHGAISVSGDKVGGHFILTEGANNTLNIITVGRSNPRGTLRIVTAKEVKGTFTTLQLNGRSPAPYTVNYLPDAIEVEFR